MRPMGSGSPDGSRAQSRLRVQLRKVKVPKSQSDAVIGSTREALADFVCPVISATFGHLYE